MATHNPKQTTLQSAAADSYSKAGAEMKQAERLLAKSKAGQAKLAKAERADGKGQKTR